MAKEIKDEIKALADFWNQRFKEAKEAKEPYATRWREYMSVWDNSMYEDDVNTHRSNYHTNFIYSTIESMRPIMFDGNTKFEAIPSTRDALQYASAINRAFEYEWERTKMKTKMIANSINTYVMGTSVVMLHYDMDAKTSADGEVEPILVNPFNLFPDPLATSVEDAEYIIYASYIHKNILKKQYPEYEENIEGDKIQYSELVMKRDEGYNTDDMVLVLEVWCRGYSEIEITNSSGKTVEQPDYEKGRVITIAPELNIVLDDKENPYESGRFPFFIFKSIDVPFKFWGESDVRWLISPQSAINDLNNQIMDNAKHTANAAWILDKNCGIPQGSLTNRPGLVIRKNPGTQVSRETPPSMPQYVFNIMQDMSASIETISGVHDITRGQTPTGVESGTAIQILQEAGQTRIRLKQTLYEESLAELGKEWLSRIKQFWKADRLIPVKSSFVQQIPNMQLNGIEQEAVQPPIIPPQNVGTPIEMDTEHMGQVDNQTVNGFDFVEVGKEQLEQDYRITVVANSSMQTSRASMLQTMVDMIKLPAEDGLPLIPREAVLDYLPSVNKDIILDYFNKLKNERQIMQQQQMMNNQAIQQLQQVSEATSGLQKRAAEEDEKQKADTYMVQGYNRGVNEGMMFKQQTDKIGDIPPELNQQLASMSSEELAEFMRQNPEYVSLLG